MRFAILGLAQTGKTSLFRILCGPQTHPEAYGAHIGVAYVPDPRLEELARIYHPKKVTPASLEFLDAPALAGDPDKDATVFGQVRGADAFVHVVRVFGEQPNPGGDGADLETEFALVDLDTVSKRLGKLERDLKKARTPELELEHRIVEKARAPLAAGTPLRAQDWSAEERKLLSGFQLLSAKPLLLVLNAGEEEAPNLEQLPQKHNLGGWAGLPGVALTEICGQIEAELAELEPADAAEFMASYGLRESARGRLLHSAYGLLGLLTFYTVGEAECRAWAVPRGTVAVEAAGTVHSDFGRRFIKAEVLPWDVLVEAGGLAAAREQGRVRLEGKQHEIHDGDVLYIRHGA